MAFYKEDIVDIDLQTGTTFRSFLNKMLGEGDIKAVRFGVRVFRDKQPVLLTGASCIGYFIRADKVTEVINGGIVTGNKAYVIVPAACFAVEGAFTLAIKIVGGGVTGTMRIVDGTVVNVTNEPINDPGGVIPDLSEIMGVIERAEAAAATIAGISITAEQITGDDYRIVVTKST